jgi:glycosyltransferase involved in cell wall biosynthesis
LRNELIAQNADPNCFISIVIPVYKEERLLDCLVSIQNCHKPHQSFEVILLFNSPKGDSAARSINQHTKAEVDEWLAQHKPYFPVFSLEENQLDDKIAGVGLARKIGMDEAARRMYAIGKAEGVILCLDADCTVASNYLQAVEAHFKDDKAKAAASLYFEHPLRGEAHESAIYYAIAYYELHLRYYKHAMRFCGLPFDRYTVGSSMAVRADAYLNEGGMNKRKAGEDFYFLQKYLIKSDLDEINATAVYPSPRRSDRVPFGTGRAVLDHLDERKDLRMTYSTKSFEVIRSFIKAIEDGYPVIPKLPEEFNGFFKAFEWEAEWKKMAVQSKDIHSFRKRFYQWFTPFRVLKLLHFLRDQHYSNMPIEKAVSELLDLEKDGVLGQLRELRKRDQF